ATLPSREPPQPRSATADTCDAWYPSGARDEGTSTLRIRIGADGSLHDPVLVSSSGNAALDDAARACLRHGHIPAVPSDGEPVVMTWQMAVHWHRGAPSWFGP